MGDKIICNNCNKEVDCFERVSEGVISDSWCLNKEGTYEHIQTEDVEVLDTIRLVCNNCRQEFSEEIQDRIFDNME